MAGPLPVGGPLGARWARCPLGARWGPVGGPLGPLAVARRARWARRARQGFGPSGGASRVPRGSRLTLVTHCPRKPLWKNWLLVEFLCEMISSSCQRKCNLIGSASAVFCS